MRIRTPRTWLVGGFAALFGVAAIAADLTSSRITSSDFDVIDRSVEFSSPGSTELDNGIVLQWGVETGISNGTSRAVSFPETFPNDVLSVTLAAEYSGGGPSVPLGSMVAAQNVTTSGFTIIYQENCLLFCDNLDVRWSAQGH